MKLSFLNVFILSLVALSCDSYVEEKEEPDGFYYYFDEKIPLYLTDDLVSLRFETSLSEEEIARVLKDHDLEVFGLATEHIMIARTTGERSANAYYTSYGSTAKRTLGDSTFVRYAAPVFRAPNGNGVGESLAGLTDEFFCEFADTVSAQTIQRFLWENQLEESDDPGKEWRNGSYLLRVTKRSDQNALEEANRLHELPYVEWASPNMLRRLYNWVTTRSDHSPSNNP